MAFVAQQGRTVGALASHCAGAFLLGAAGLLDDRRAATYPGGDDDLRATTPAAVIVDDNVVQDGNLITASGAAVSYRRQAAMIAACRPRDRPKNGGQQREPGPMRRSSW